VAGPYTIYGHSDEKDRAIMTLPLILIIRTRLPLPKLPPETWMWPDGHHKKYQTKGIQKTFLIIPSVRLVWITLAHRYYDLWFGFSLLSNEANVRII